MHRLLKRQLRKLGLAIDKSPQQKDWQVFIERIDQSYHDTDDARYTLERSLSISSSEIRNLYEEKLQDSETRFRMVLEKTDVISIQGYDREHRVTYWNPASEALYGYTEEEALGQTLEELIIPPEMREQVRTAINNWINDAVTIPSGELTLCKSDGSPVDVFSSHILFYNSKNEPEMYCLDIDISIRKQYEQKILHQAHFDSLTDLPNRFLSLDRLTQLLIEAERESELIAVLFLDLDDFKKVNDTLGHEVGDKILIKTAQRLTAELRAGDTVGRLGGDEFIVLLSDLNDISDAQPIAENLLAQLRNAFIIDGREIILGVSIGIAIFPWDAKTPSELLRNADIAMYHAKDQGRNTYTYFTNEMNRDVSSRLEMEEQLYTALDNDELEVYYQPKINIITNEIMGAEALLRWKNSLLGNISPVDFIPIAEQTGLIVSIGQYVLTQALNMTAHWQQAYNPQFHIAINLSPRQFRHSKLISFIEKSMKSAGVSAQSVELEITEGLLMGGDKHIADSLLELSKLGISLSMDDFGTGYSSLSYLQNYPFHVLKIDRSFVKDMMFNSKNKELVQAIIAMAHGLKFDVVAEGVETEEQFECLKQLNCDYAQGYLFSKPIPAKEMSKLLKQNMNNL